MKSLGCTYENRQSHYFFESSFLEDRTIAVSYLTYRHPNRISKLQLCVSSSSDSFNVLNTRTFIGFSPICDVFRQWNVHGSLRPVRVLLRSQKADLSESTFLPTIITVIWGCSCKILKVSQEMIGAEPAKVDHSHWLSASGSALSAAVLNLKRDRSTWNWRESASKIYQKAS